MAKARTRRPQTRRPAPARSRRPAAKNPARTTRVGQSSRKALSPHKGDIQGVALALFWRPAAKDDMVAGRVTIGLLAVLVGGLGLLHLAKGAPPASSAPAVLQDSGGLVGAIIAAPLARLLSTWGAGA